MTFVYTGKGKRAAQGDDAPPEQKDCAKQACAIQWCLAKRGQKEQFCQSFIDDWKECTRRSRAAAGVETSVDGAAVETTDGLATTPVAKGKGNSK
mmetsp:Transcript_997/g.1734  ORF Transcript_997/g.1734 Transcript_997/m.1734 type:complete len:95 (-) Transcript_997:1310-1594(-)